jgi:pyrroloquinoline quinone biosynthesis protein B
MQIRILGSAAGGGFPQWNCRCRNCRRLRAGKLHAAPRTQAQVAVSSDGDQWFLLNASPDLRAQIEASPCLHPRNGARGSPLAGIVLTGAELDQVLGLLLLRELQPLRIYATSSVRRMLREDNTLFAALAQTPQQTRWTDIVPGDGFALATAGDVPAGIRCRALSLNEHWPGYVPAAWREVERGESVLALVIDSPGGGRLVYMPSAAEVDEASLEVINSADVLLFDGTFWTDDELCRISGRTARQMGHMPVSGPDGSLQRLAAVTRPRKIYIHVNNTNPILDEDGPEYRAVRAAGWEVAEDGWQFAL